MSKTNGDGTTGRSIRRLGHTGSNWSGHIPALDGVRGLAIGAVIGFHYVVELFPGGAVGVDLFFVLSAFLITSLLVREHDQNGSIDWRSFYWRRAGRLGPALVVFVVLAAGVTAARGEAHLIVGSTVSSMLYLTDFAVSGLIPIEISSVYGHTWSLAVEEQFYIVWPALLLVLLRRHLPLVRWAAVAWLASLVISAVATLALGPGSNYFAPTGHLHALAAGVLAAVAAPYAVARNDVVSRRGRGAVAAALVVLLLVVFFPWLVKVGLGVPGTLVVGPASAVLIVHAAVVRRGVVVRLLSMSWLTWLGARSYGLYLYNSLFYEALPVLPGNLSRSSGVILGVGATLLLAEVSFRVVERPILRWVRHKHAPVPTT